MKSINNEGINLSRSNSLFEVAKELTPGGIHSNVRWMEPHPMYFNKGLGSRIWDIDGNEYLDCMTNYGALILGHGDPEVIRVVKEQLDKGLTAGVETELNVEVAQKMTQMIPCCEMVRFSNSGTEAIMHAIHIARGFTKKERIVKAEGHYHGWYDYVYCSNRYSYRDWPLPKPYPSSEGLCEDLSRKTLVVPWNDLEEMEKLINEYKDEIAAVIMEPVNHNIGCALPKKGYLEGVRELTEKNNILLIFDEVITGFRVAPGGAQEFYKVTPDLATFGKAIANGFPLSAVAGKRNVMEIISPSLNRVSFGGTYNGHQLAIAAASATLKKLKTGEVQRHLNRLTEKLVNGFNGIAAETGVAARMQGFGGKFQVYFSSLEVVDWRTASGVDQQRYKRFRDSLLQKGILWSYSCFSHPSVTAAHNDEDIHRILQASRDILKRLVRE
jgi:glutamate-1-semialdehyde 2,1-aminomutase